MGKFIRCHFAIPERFRGLKVIFWRRGFDHMAHARFVGVPGDFDVPDWWMERIERSTREDY